MDIRAKAKNLKIALDQLSGRRFEEALNYAINVFISNYGRGSKEVHELEKLKANYDNRPKPVGMGMFESESDKNGYYDQLKAIFRDFIKAEEDNNVSYFKEIKLQLKSPDKELDGLNALKQFFYDCEDPYEWSSIVFEMFKEVFGPGDERTRLVRITKEDLPYTEEGMKNESIVREDAYGRIEILIDQLILMAKEKSGIYEMKVTPQAEQPLPPKKKWFNFSNISIPVWGLILIVIGGAFKFGFEFGHNKFDSEKNVLYQENLQLQEQVKQLDGKIISIRDSVQNAVGENVRKLNNP